MKDLLNNFLEFFDFHQKQDIIIFSHIRWDFAVQQPHYIVPKLAKKNKILFIEEPIPFHPLDRGKTSLFYPEKNITVLQPQIAMEHIKQELPLLIAKQLRVQKMQTPILWFYSTAFSDIIPFLNHSLIIYDYISSNITKYRAEEEYLLSIAVPLNDR